MCNLMYSLEIVLSIFNQKNLADINVRRYTMLNLENMHCSTSQPNWNQAKKMYYYSSSPVEECLCRPWRSVSEVINSWVFLYTGVKAGQNYELSKTQDFLETKEKNKTKQNKQTNKPSLNNRRILTKYADFMTENNSATLGFFNPLCFRPWFYKIM